MTAFLSFLATQRNGIAMLLIVLGALAGLLNWLLWMFRRGRFRGTSPQTDQRLRVVLTDFFVKLIDDFRHLLALVIVLLFALALFLAMLPGVHSGNLNDIKDDVQVVAASVLFLTLRYNTADFPAKGGRRGGPHKRTRIAIVSIQVVADGSY
jgi:hypothetical protein